MQLIKSDNLLSTLYRIQFPEKGKVFLFADFDGTFMPFSHKSVCTERSIFPKEEFSRYFGLLSDFLKNNEKRLELIITTGRNLPKFIAFLEHIKRNEAHIPLPKKIIVNNGGDIYTSNNPENIFKDGDAGYTNDNSVARAKRAVIKKLTGWDGSEIKNKIIAVLNSLNFQVLEVPINEFSSTYDELTLQYYLEKYGLNHNTSKFASIQDDGLLGFHIAFCKELNNDEDYLNRLCQAINDSLEKKVSYSVQTTFYDWQAGYGPSIRLLPIIEGKPLNKLYDIKECLKKVMENNTGDLVIAAGDDENDLPMLTQESYKDLDSKTIPFLGIQIINC